MSEFQFHEFRSIDKALTNEERKIISSWSSRAEVSAYSAKFTYSYSDFPKNEETVLLNYFDAYLYEASWGQRQVIFKFPKDLVSFSELRQYDIAAEGDFDGGLKVSKKDSFVLVSFSWNEEEDGGRISEDPKLENFIAVREDILKGNNSFLFLFWLQQCIINQENEQYNDEDDDDDYEDEEKPQPITKIPLSMIPQGLHKVSETTLRLMDFFEISRNLVQAVCEHLPPPASTEKPNLKEKIKNLPIEEKDAFLLRLLNNESNLRLHLERALTAPKRETTESTSKEEIYIKIEDILK